MPSSSLIISTYNNPRALSKILNEISIGTQLPEKVIIADDGSGNSTEDSINSARKQYPISLIHCRHEDRGFRKSKILNEAILRAEGTDYIIFLDGDCVPEKNFIADHLQIAEMGYFVQGRRAFIDESSVFSYLDGKVSMSGLFLRGKVSGGFKAIRWPRPFVSINQKMRGLIGCNLAIWRSDLIRVNGFDQEYEGWGGEDSDLCVRLYNIGLKRKMVYGRCRVYHLNHKEADKSTAHERFQRLEESVKRKKTICQKGIKFLK